MKDTEYTVNVRPGKIGHVSSVAKRTRIGDGDFWVGWDPEPTFWRPTESWAIRRAAAKKRRTEASDARHTAIRSVNAQPRACELIDGEWIPRGTRFIKSPHSCIRKLPLVEFLVQGTIVECGECGKWWRAVVPGNPEYAWWKRAWVRQWQSK